MSKQLLEISSFKECIQNDETNQSNKWFVDMLWLDPWTEDWVLQINKRLEANTTTWLTDNIKWFTTFNGKIIWCNDWDELWYENTTDTWTLLHTNTNWWWNDDIIVYQDYLIYASNTKLWRSTLTTIAGWFTDNPSWWSWTTFTNTWKKHFFKIYNNRLYITDWQYLAELDWASAPGTPTSWVFTAEKFTLPKWENIISLEVLSWYLALWTDVWNFYLWDWASSNASQIIKTSLWWISAMIQVENTLFVYAWVSWVWYRYNGADLIPVIKIPNFNISANSFVYKTAVRRYKNWFIFWISRNWIYVYNRVKEWESFWLNKYWHFSWWKIMDETTWVFNSLYIIDQSSSDDAFICSYSYDSTIYIDKVASFNRYRMYEAWLWDTSASPYIETYVYELRDINWQANKIQWIQALFKDDTSWKIENNIEIEYRLNNTESYTVLWDIWEDWIDINKILRGIWKRVHKVQFRIKIWRKTTNTSNERNTKLIWLKIY